MGILKVLLVTVLAMICVVATAGAIYGFVLGSWVHGLIELAVAALSALAAYLIRGRKQKWFSRTAVKHNQ